VLDVEETAEIAESLSLLKQKAKQIADLMRSSSHTIVFTGAGISVSAGIPTYRGIDGIDVVAKLGGPASSLEPQAVEEVAVKEEAKNRKKKAAEVDPSIEASEDYLKLKPTLSHQLISRWLNADRLVHYVITQNCDDLHGRSGVPADRLSELHGNVFIEMCEFCGKEYRRPYCVDLFSTDCTQEPWHVPCPACRLNHFTGRRCSAPRCRGRLRDTIVNFGDDLHATALGGLARAEAECRRAALALCVGSSMTVTPASDLPEALPPGGAIVIVNLQATGLDDRAAVRVWGQADPVLALIQAELARDAPAAPAPAAGSAAAGCVDPAAATGVPSDGGAAAAAAPRAGKRSRGT
jgi:NAD+-dependent protein deacetylase sirtuin 6